MSERGPPWGLLGVGAAASLCCIGSSAVGGAALAGGALAGGLGAGLIQASVTALTVGLVGLAWQWRRGGESACEPRERR